MSVVRPLSILSKSALEWPETILAVPPDCLMMAFVTSGSDHSWATFWYVGLSLSASLTAMMLR